VNLACFGISHRTAPVALREAITIDAAALPVALEALAACGGEAIILSTCNRTELYSTAESFTAADAIRVLVAQRAVDIQALHGALTSNTGPAAVEHLFRVAGGLDSLVLGEGQIAAQVKTAYESAQRQGTAGALLNPLFSQALRVAKRVRTETAIARGHASVSSVAVDFTRQVFDRFDDKTVLVIGAGKMARLTLTHLRDLAPQSILVTNRNPERAAEVARECGGIVVPWNDLDAALARADIALSTTGAPEVIMTRARFESAVAPHRGGRMLVVLDIAVPRDFDATIHDGDNVYVFNIDDLRTVRDVTLRERQNAVAPAEAIVQAEVRRFLDDWQRRRSGPVIQKLQSEVDRIRDAVTHPLFDKLNGKLSDTDREYIAGAFRLFQNRLLHGPIAALQESARDEQGHTLLDSLKKLFRLD
jgi:glutamyl-tRNA reductase